jgi:hypothetical protein
MLRYWIPTCAFTEPLEEAISASLHYLKSEAAHQSIARDPYWPKWDSPWWHVQCLREIGLTHRIPQPILDTLFQTTKSHYLPIFPFSDAEIPEGCDPYRSTRCHCQIGSQILLALQSHGSLEEHLPPAVEWFTKYQLPDGGVNCDGETYPRPRPVSSFVSTAPVLEALLESELLGVKIPDGVVDGLARFFIERKLHRSFRSGVSVRPEWETPIFPRFYEYDLLRGVAILTQWMHRRDRWLNEPWFSDLVDSVTTTRDHNAGQATMRTHHNAFSIHPQDDHTWTNGKSTSFLLLDLLSMSEHAEPFLQCQRNGVLWMCHAAARSL